MRSFTLTGLALLVGALLLGACTAPAPGAVPTAARVASGQPQVTLATQPDPALTVGETELIIDVKDVSGQPLEGAAVIVIADMGGHSMDAMQGLATDQGNGRYATKAPLEMAGDWTITVEVRQGDAVLTTQEFIVRSTDNDAQAPASLPASGVQGSVWVVNEAGDSISVMDAGTNKVIATLTGIPGPHNVQAAPDGSSAWAVSGHGAAAVMVDTTSYTAHGVVPTGQGPAHIIVTPDGKTVYTSNSGDDTVSAIDTETMQTMATIPVGQFPHGLRPSPDGKWVYVANMQSDTVSVIDTTSNTRVADIAVGKGPVQVGFSPDGASVYVSLNAENAVGKIDVASGQLTAKVSVGSGPVQVYVTPNGKTLLVANQGVAEEPGTTVSFIDTETFKVVDTVETGKGAHGVVIEPSGRFAYVTNLYDNTLAVVDIPARRLVTVVPTGAEPNGVSFVPGPAGSAPASQIDLALPSMEQDTDMGMDHDG